jgi:stage V sporulation protein B
MSSSLQRFARDVGLSFASIAISSLVHLILRVFLARYVGPADLGLYTLAFTFYSFGMLLSAFGIGWALVKYVAESKEDTSHTGRLLSIGAAFSLLIGCISCLALYLSAPWIAVSFFHMPELGALLRIVAFALPFIAVEKATLGFLNGLRRMGLYTVVNVSQNVLTVALTLALVLLGYGVNGAVLALVLPVALLSSFSVFAVRRSLRKPAIGQYAPVARTLLRFGTYVVLASAIGMALYNTDRIMLGYFLDNVAVGIYSIAATLVLVLHLPSQAIQLITNPTIASHWAQGEIRRIEDFVNRTMKITGMLILPLSFALAFLAEDLITLVFGAAYASATVPLQILLVGFVVGGLLTSVGTALSSTAYVHVGFIITSIQLVANVALNVALIPPFGMNGAAAATSAALILGALVSFYLMQRLIRIAIDWRWFARFLLTGAVVYACAFALALIINPYVCMLLGLAVLAIVTKKFFLAKEDQEAIVSVLSLKRGIMQFLRG